MTDSWADTDRSDPAGVAGSGETGPERFVFEVKSSDGVRVVRPTGSDEIPAERVEEFLAAVAPLAKPAGARVALDLSSVEFFGPGTIDALIGLSDDAIRGGGRLVVFGLAGVVGEVFQLAGLDVVVGVFPCEDSAVTFLRREPRRRETWH